MAGRRLDEYRRKRDFSRTPEPEGGRRRGPAGARVFVVHRHDARRLHYDLRLQMEGVLRSWAVPKGFDYDPRAKHLAVRTEDHPLAYETFHGVIPEGSYGAGAMTIWDHGHYETVGGVDPARAVEEGELKIVLSGRRLRGEWHLVRTGAAAGRDWLLFKSRDRYAGPARQPLTGLPLEDAPQAPLPARAPRPMEASAVSAPFDDPAWIFEAALAGRRTFARRDRRGARLPGLRRRLPAIEEALLHLAAEEALLDGVLVAPDERELPDPERLRRALAGESLPLAYYAHDLLFWDGLDLRGLPLLVRKSALRAALPEGGPLLYLDHVTGDGKGLSRAAAEAGLTELLARRADAPYTSGPSPDVRRVTWPAVPGVAARRGNGRGGGLPRATAAAGKGAAGRPPSSRGTPRRARPASPRVRISNPEKVFWPVQGFTKADLVAYYDSVADVLLPYLAGRPVHMHRFPDGVQGPSFYQRHANETVPSWVPRVWLDSESKGEPQPYIVCDDRDTLLALANLGSIDLHPWLSRADDPHHPDSIVLDLDPNGAPFAHVVALARRAGELLHGVGLSPLLKTSGKSGLHVVLPLPRGRYDYEQARTFCEIIARLLCLQLPELGTIERSPGKRGGRTYVDFLQNRRGQTVVPPYVVRPVAAASVSTPLGWDELDASLDPAAFTLATVPARVAQRGDLFEPALHDGPDLLEPLAALSEQLSRSRGRARER